MSASENENKKPGGYMHHLPFHPPLTAAQTRDIGWIRQQVADLHDVLPRMKVAETITRKLGPGPREGAVVEVQNGGRDMARALTYLRAFHATAELAIAGGPPMPDSLVKCQGNWEEADALTEQAGARPTPAVGEQTQQSRRVWVVEKNGQFWGVGEDRQDEWHDSAEHAVWITHEWAAQKDAERVGGCAVLMSPPPAVAWQGRWSAYGSLLFGGGSEDVPSLVRRRKVVRGRTHGSGGVL